MEKGVRGIFKWIKYLGIFLMCWDTYTHSQKRIRLFEALRNFFIRLSQAKPLIMVVDDLQWIDKTSEEFISYFIEWIPNCRILPLLLYRQEYSHTWGSKFCYQQIGLFPLSEDESRAFIYRLLSDAKVSPPVEIYCN